MNKIKYHYYCHLCGKDCYNLSSFYNHIKTHDTNKLQYWIDYDIEENLYECKVCKKRLVKHDKLYCSNDCKFSDKTLNKKRARKQPNDSTKQMRCTICDKVINDTVNASGGLTTHLKNEHNIITKKYKDYFTLEDKPYQKLFHCPLCEWTTVDLTNKSGWFTTHLKNEHNLTPFEYVDTYPSDRHLWEHLFHLQEQQDFLNENKDNFIRCDVCGEHFKKITETHLATHGLTTKQYKLKYNSNICSVATSNKQSIITTKHNLLHGSVFKDKTSSLELDFKNKLIDNNINFIAQYLFNCKKYDFNVDNKLIEIDGTFYHPTYLVDLTLQQISNAINDYNKINDAKNSDYTLYKIHWSKNMIFSDYNTLYNLLVTNQYFPNYNVTNDQIIMNEQYITNYLTHKGKLKMTHYITLLIRFVRTFIHSLDYIDKTQLHHILTIMFGLGTNTPINFTINNITNTYNETYK